MRRVRQRANDRFGAGRLSAQGRELPVDHRVETALGALVTGVK